MSKKFIFINPNISADTNPLDIILPYITLSQGVRCCTDYGIAPLAKNLNPPPGTKNNFSNVSLSEGTVTLEFCVELPETLSSPSEDIEDWIENVKLASGDIIEIGLSNQMAFYYHWINDLPFVTISRRINAEQIRKYEHSLGCAPRLAHTMACTRITVNCENVYDTICEHAQSLQDNLVEAVLKLSLAHLLVDSPQNRSSYPLYQRGVFEYGYLGIFGSNDTAATTQLWINPNKSALQSSLCSKDDADKISTLLTDGFDTNSTNQLLLPLAKASLSAGVTHYAFITAFIFAETLCSSVCKHQMLAKGVSSSKYKKSSRSISSSIAINLLLQSLCETPPPKDVLATLDSSRKLRNELMHDGSMAVDSNVVKKLIKAAEALEVWANEYVFQAG